MSYASVITGEVIEVSSVPVGLIDNGPAVRVELLNNDHVLTLQENLDHLPNIAVRIRGDRYQLIDGRHRLAAHKLAKRDTITAEIYDLDDREAEIAAIRANVIHGRALTLSERRNSARRLVDTAPDLSNREIARICGLSHHTVGKLRPESDGGQIAQTKTPQPAPENRTSEPSEAPKLCADCGAELAWRRGPDDLPEWFCAECEPPAPLTEVPPASDEVSTSDVVTFFPRSWRDYGPLTRTPEGIELANWLDAKSIKGRDTSEVVAEQAAKCPLDATRKLHAYAETQAAIWQEFANRLTHIRPTLGVVK